MAASALAIAACGSGGSGDGDTPTIASVGPLTGVGADVGQSQSVALRMGLDDAKREDGAELELIEEDTGESNTSARNAFQRALEQQPAAIWGPFLGTQILAIRPLIERAGVPTLATSGTDTITEDGNTEVFRWYASQGTTESTAAEWALEELGVERPAILHDSTEYGQAGADVLAETLSAAGAEPVSTESLNPTDKDVSGQVSKIASAKPDAVFVEIIGGATGAVALKDLRAAGLDVPYVWGSGIISRGMLDLVTDEEVEGVYGNVPGAVVGTPDSKDPAIRDFFARFEKKTGREGDLAALFAYDGGRFLGQAVADGDTTSEQIAERLREQPYEGLAGTYRADDEGNMMHATTIVEMKDRQPVLVETFDEAPAGGE